MASSISSRISSQKTIEFFTLVNLLESPTVEVFNSMDLSCDKESLQARTKSRLSAVFLAKASK
jgi:hypothetical protein